MKTILLGGAVLLALALALALETAAAAPFCFMRYQLDHVEAPNDKVMFFFLRDGEVYANHPIGLCPGLSLAADLSGLQLDGSQGTGEICDNLISIRLRQTGGETCLMGAFEKTTQEAAEKVK